MNHKTAPRVSAGWGFLLSLFCLQRWPTQTAPLRLALAGATRSGSAGVGSLLAIRRRGYAPSNWGQLEQRLFFFLRFNEYEDRAVQNMGQLYCHTKPPSASRRVTAHRINDRCNRTGFRRSNALLRR